jgi:hypothetical protein
VAQYISGDGGSGVGGVHFDLETNVDNVTPYIYPVTPGYAYWDALGCDWRGGVGHLIVYDGTTGSQVGSVSHPLGKTNWFYGVRIGNDEMGQGQGAIYFENVIIDYTTHQWPMSFNFAVSKRVNSVWR